MILTGSEIEAQVSKGRITIDPFDPARLNPNSYNFQLGDVLKVYDESLLDVRRANSTKEFPIPSQGSVLYPDRVYLGATMEVMGSDHYVPIIRARSGVARLGLFIHITADLIDIGSVNQWTLQLHAVQPLRIYAGMLLGQVTFWRTEGKVTLYDGKYQGSRGPRESEIHRDFEPDDSWPGGA